MRAQETIQLAWQHANLERYSRPRHCAAGIQLDSNRIKKCRSLGFSLRAMNEMNKPHSQHQTRLVAATLTLLMLGLTLAPVASAATNTHKEMDSMMVCIPKTTICVYHICVTFTNICFFCNPANPDVCIDLKG
jgi:hypothetical protein